MMDPKDIFTPVRQMKLDALLELLGRTRGLPGDVCEMGVFRGRFLRRIALAVPEKTCYGFDTFAGMPADKCLPHDGHRPGEFCETSLHDVQRDMPSNVVLVRGTFPEAAAGVDVDRVCFAHVDFDLELSMTAAIEWLRPRMVPGGIMLFDDWNKDKMPGVDRAIERAQLQVVKVTKHQAYWVKR